MLSDYEGREELRGVGRGGEENEPDSHCVSRRLYFGGVRKGRKISGNHGGKADRPAGAGGLVRPMAEGLGEAVRKAEA